MAQPFEITLDLGGLEVEVIGTYRVGCEPITDCLPQDSYPGHSSELEIVSVYHNRSPLEIDRQDFLENWSEKIWLEIEG